MKTLSFIVTNKEEEIDLLQTIERERPGVRWWTDHKPSEWIPSEKFVAFPYSIDIQGKTIERSFVVETTSAPYWQIGQSLPKSALALLLEIPENEDGSVTISKELKAQIKMELEGGDGL